MIKKRLLAGISTALCVVLLVVTLIAYWFFTSTHIFNESANHLFEIYNQVNVTYSSIIENNWKVL